MYAVLVLSLASFLVPPPGTCGPAQPAIRSPYRCYDASCCDAGGEIPESVAESIPPEQLADAWKRDEKAKELAETLKGCSLYLVGFGARKTAVGKLLSKRLPRYRFYDVGALMCSTYAAMGGGEALGMQQLIAKEPTEDVAELSRAVLREVQQFTRSVFVAWDGAVEPSDYMIMQQGIVVNLEFEELEEDEVALPSEGAVETREAWETGHRKADVTVTLAKGLAADEAAYQVVQSLLAFIEANPAKSGEWKEKADTALEEKE